MGMEQTPLGTKVSHDESRLIIGRILDLSWNGRKYICQGTLISGETVNNTISLWVKGHYTNIIIAIHFRK